MKNSSVIAVGFVVSVLVGLSATTQVRAAAGQDRDDARARQYAGSLDARQHGYEHAYRDGADRGRQDRERRMKYSLRDNDYQIGARTYERAFGERTEYMQGYRDGYKAGYDDAFNGRDGQYGRLYGRSASGRPGSSSADVYTDRAYSSTDMAFDTGYREGITLGQRDRGGNSRSNFRNDSAYKNADQGYRSTDGDRAQYQIQFRDGVERGYEDGFGRTTTSGTDSANRSANTGSNRDVNNRRSDGDARNSATTQGGTFTVPGNRQWTPTGIRVHQGDVLRFTSTGEIRFTGNADDRAGVAGSAAHKFVAGSPLPAALAGALIGRIDNGLPFGIGDQSTIIAPASGLLYLGTNDDNVSDNSGQFQVIISPGR